MRIVFMGTPDFAVPCLQALARNHDVAAVITQPDKVQGRGHRIIFSAVTKAALDLEIPVHQPAKINDPNFLDQLEALKADLFVVVAYGQLLGRRIRRMARYRAVNVHASLLPKLRGGAPIHRAIINGDRETGISIMRVERRLDSGAVYLQRALPIGPDATVGEIHDELAELGAAMLLEVVDRLPGLKPVPQDDSQATFAPVITKADRLIDWTDDAVDVYNRIRGLNPWPTAVSHFRGKLLQISGARILKSGGQDRMAAGSVIRLENEGPVIRCGQGSLLLTRVKPAGKKWMSGADFCRGYRPQSGELLE